PSSSAAVADRATSAARAVVLFYPVAVFAASHVLDPGRVLEIPGDRLAEAGLEGFGRGPAELGLCLGRIDRIATIVPGAIPDELDLPGIRARCPGPHLVEQAADGPHHVDVLQFVLAADVVGLADPPGLQDAADARAVVADVEPVAHVLAVAVHGQRLAVE